MASAVRLRNRFWLQMKRSFRHWFKSPLSVAEFDTAQPRRSRNCPGLAVETIGSTAGASHRTNDLHGLGDNQMNQNGEWASESRVNPPAIQPSPSPTFY